MEMGMMSMSSTMILGMHLEIFLMVLSGVFYIICAGFFWLSYKKEKNELIGALIAFLVYQAISMFFMGLEMQTMKIVYSNIAALAVFIGSAYMLKFPFSSFSSGVRRAVFLISLFVVLCIFAWYMQTEARQMALMHFTLWYDLVINGIVVGGFMLIIAVRTSERLLKFKALGGGAGVVTCCIISNGAMIGGAMITSSVFAFLAPILILGSFALTRKGQSSQVRA